MNFPNGLKYYRRLKGITQSKLGENIGVNNTTVSNWEKGVSRPDMDSLVRLSEYLGVSPTDLLYFDGTPEDRGTDYPVAHATQGRVADIRQDYTAGGTSQASVPFFRIGSPEGYLALFAGEKPVPSGHVSVPNMPGCDGAVEVRGEGMSPLVGNGDIVVYRQVSDPGSGILWGEMYIAVYEAGGNLHVSVRYVLQSDVPGCVRLAASNPSHAPLDIPQKKLKALALVKLCIRYAMI